MDEAAVAVHVVAQGGVGRVRPAVVEGGGRRGGIRDRRLDGVGLQPCVEVLDDVQQGGRDVHVVAGLDDGPPLVDPVSDDGGEDNRPRSGERVTAVADELEQPDDLPQVPVGGVVLLSRIHDV